jgi:DNA-binding winged helix-turn-helix (wHTH) protein
VNERFRRAALLARVDLAHEADFALGQVKVFPARREIVGDGFQDVLEPRVMQVLVALARARGEILSRDDLIECCWERVVVGEDAINRCIGRLRKTAEASGNAFVIETVPRVGYRLRLPKADAAFARADAPPEAPPAAAMPPPKSGLAKSLTGPRSLIAAGAVLALIVPAIAVWQLWPWIAEPAPTPGGSREQTSAPDVPSVQIPFNTLTFNSWDVAAQFNDATFDNPYDVWRYGKQAKLNSGFSRLEGRLRADLRADVDPMGYFKGWVSDENHPYKGPGVTHNTQNFQITGSGSVFPPHAFSMHPSETCEYAVTRFVVPMPGKYQLSGRFYAMDAYGTTTDVHISVNRVPVWNSFINHATQPDASFTTFTTAGLKPRDTIDFQVGCGSNGNFYNDATGLHALIERKP